MKIKLLALEVYHDNEIAQVIPLRDNDDRVSLTYPTKYFSFEDLKAAVAGRSETMKSFYFGQYGLGKERIHFDEEAWYMPCIGKIRVQCQEREIEWPVEHEWWPK
jgi:hypothetical protein